MLWVTRTTTGACLVALATATTLSIDSFASTSAEELPITLTSVYRFHATLVFILYFSLNYFGVLHCWLSDMFSCNLIFSYVCFAVAFCSVMLLLMMMMMTTTMMMMIWPVFLLSLSQSHLFYCICLVRWSGMEFYRTVTFCVLSEFCCIGRL